MGATPKCLVDTLGQRAMLEPQAPGAGPSALRLAWPHPGTLQWPLCDTHISSRATSKSLPAKTCSLFPPSYVQDKYLLRLLRSADDVSTWVAAEIVTCHTSKVGAPVTLSSERGVGANGTGPAAPCGT